MKYNKDNGKFYLVNGSGNPPSLDIVSLNVDSDTLTKDKTILIEPLAETDGFAYGDLTSVDVNTTTKRISVSVQEEDPVKNGKILVLDYDGNLLKTYEAGSQPDMIKSTADGKYILTANEGEHRGAAVDPQGSITIVNTVNDTVASVLFDDASVIDDHVHIRGESDAVTGQITGSGTKADAVFDFEPEYITLSEDNTKAYVSLQENNAIAEIDIAANKVNAVTSLGLKDYNEAVNALDLVKDNAIKLENVPFYGMYMPDGIASYAVDGQTYLLTANEGDVTEWDGRTNASTVGEMKGSLESGSTAAQFLSGTTTYDSVEVASDMGHDSIYMYGGRSFSIWNADTMSQVFDSGNDFETITAERLPENFNTSNSKTAMDNRSAKKGPEPEDVKVGIVGNKVIAFVGLERIGGIMTYDVTNPAEPTFANYINTRAFTPSDNLNTDTGPEGIEFIPAAISPTGLPLLLVAYEVGGRVAVFQLDVTKVTLDQTKLSLTAGASASKLTASVIPAPNGAATVTWSSSNSSVAAVDASGNVTPVAKGTAVITAISADGYGSAESIVTVKAAGSGNGSGDSNSGGDTSTTEPATDSDVKITNGDAVKATIEVEGSTDSEGKATATATAKQVADLLAELKKSAVSGKDSEVEIRAVASGNAAAANVQFEKGAFALLANSGASALTLQTDIGTVSFDSKAIAAISKPAGSGEVKVTISGVKPSDAQLSEAAKAKIGDRPVYDFTVVAGDSAISDFNGGKASISVPYTPQADEDTNAIVVYYITDSGELVAVPDSIYNAVDGTLHFKVSHFSNYAAGYHKITFHDTGASFAEDAITYLSARDIITGLGSNSFGPKANITRADFTLILARIAAVNLDEYSSTSFTDIEAADYYAKSVEWAAKNGITSGIGSGQFSPKKSITREQMVTMIVRFADVTGFTLPVTVNAVSFEDSALVAAYASDAARAVQQAGIINGKTLANQSGSYFAPQDFATREEAAKMLANLLQLMAQ